MFISQTVQCPLLDDRIPPLTNDEGQSVGSVKDTEWKRLTTDVTKGGKKITKKKKLHCCDTYFEDEALARKYFTGVL